MNEQTNEGLNSIDICYTKQVSWIFMACSWYKSVCSVSYSCYNKALHYEPFVCYSLWQHTTSLLHCHWGTVGRFTPGIRGVTLKSNVGMIKINMYHTQTKCKEARIIIGIYGIILNLKAALGIIFPWSFYWVRLQWETLVWAQPMREGWPSPYPKWSL